VRLWFWEDQGTVDLWVYFLTGRVVFAGNVRGPTLNFWYQIHCML
jgi:hypothetical protein